MSVGMSYAIERSKKVERELRRHQCEGLLLVYSELVHDCVDVDLAEPDRSLSGRVVASVSTPRSRGRLEASRRLASVSPRSRGLAPRSRSRA